MARPRKPRKGRSLERLVETLERSISKVPGAKVESPKRFVDALTGQSREHDVVITLTQGLQELTVAIECRDRSRPFGVPDLEAFRQKCLDTRVSRGVVVSPKGFQESALEKAKVYGISCMNLSDAPSFDWLALSTLPVYSRVLVHIDLTLVVDTPALEAVNDPNVDFVCDDGEKLTLEQVKERLRGYLVDHSPAVKQDGMIVMPFGFNVTGLSIAVPHSGDKHPVKRFEGKAYFQVSRRDSAFRLVSYEDASGSSNRVEAAVAPIALGALKGNFVVVMRKDGGEVLFVPDRSSTKDA